MKKLFTEKLAALINVKTIVTFGVIGAFVTLAFRGEINANVMTQVVTMVVAFYFGTQHEKKRGE